MSVPCSRIKEVSSSCLSGQRRTYQVLADCRLWGRTYFCYDNLFYLPVLSLLINVLLNWFEQVIVSQYSFANSLIHYTFFTPYVTMCQISRNVLSSVTAGECL